MPKSFASIDSVDGDSDDLDYEDDDYALAQKEWEESLSQLTQVFSVVLLPYFGKWLGRRYAYAGTFIIPSPLSERHSLTFCKAYARYLQVGLGKAFFGLRG